ncbi:hypothetical protein GGTG_03598 [Gaeumannomyces tritici R3-111a-1]|uniref:Uncharacterized protein n=1 Tax=Gaeumannomyces tritici (strain R3-111a-1) TaxID=644352 RepID=J3NQP2_GAET3|nr:hypothetical protein GGTG_03598 [Gaeumannomyces tritici R3-111a-1]EJT78498.1 hypothetical protein GGTG_03598 [Gaeumannomyces tritici R3-111a-1]
MGAVSDVRKSSSTLASRRGHRSCTTSSTVGARRPTAAAAGRASRRAARSLDCETGCRASALTAHWFALEVDSWLSQFELLPEEGEAERYRDVCFGQYILPDLSKHVLIRPRNRV